MRAALYERVSTMEQVRDGLSIDNQHDALMKYASANKMKVVGTYTDAGVSGHISYKKRPELQRMIADCRKGIIDIIIVTRIDRFFRSVPDYYSFMKDTNETPWKAIWEDYDTTTSAGRLKLNILLSVSQSESERTSERIASVHQYRREQGAFVGSAPTGYDLKKVDGKTTLVKNQDREMVEFFFHEYLKNFSVTETVRLCQMHGYQINHRLGRRIATNPTYRGHYQNSVYEGYITDRQWDEIQEQRKIRTRVGSRKNTYIFAGLLKCQQCGGTLLAYTNSKMPGKLMYRCSHPQAKDHIEHYNRVYESDIEKWLLNRFSIELDKVTTKYEFESEKADFEPIKANLKRKLERLKILYEEGDIEIGEYREKRDKLKAEMEKVPDVGAQKEPPKLPDGWQNIYKDLDAEQKKTFWRKAIDHIDIDYGEQHDDARYHLTIRMV